MSKVFQGLSEAMATFKKDFALLADYTESIKTVVEEVKDMKLNEGRKERRHRGKWRSRRAELSRDGLHLGWPDGRHKAFAATEGSLGIFASSVILAI